MKDFSDAEEMRVGVVSRGSAGPGLPDELRGARVLVTGGAGFIGIPLVRKLADAGYEVGVLDNFRMSNAGRISSLCPPGTLMEVDLVDRVSVLSAVKEWRPQITFHLAALHFIPECRAHPSETLAINILGTQHLLDALAALPEPGRILFVSTADVYRPSTEPHSEWSATSPDNVYGLSKYTAERLVEQYHVATGAPVTIVRQFNVYGPGETNPHIIPEIVAQLHVGDHLRLGNLDARRDYIYVDDVAEGLLALGSAPPPNQAVNLATGQSHSGHRLIAEMAELTGRSLHVEQDPARLRPSDRPNLQADVTFLRSHLPGFTPLPITEGLRLLLRAEGLLDRAERLKEPDAP